MSIFNKIAVMRPKSSQFDLSHDVKMTFDMGELVPSCVMDVLPGDKFKIRNQNMLRFTPLVAPVMHRVNVTTHYFFVPNRILWSEWEDFIFGNQEIEPPYILNTNGINNGSIGDYLGVPVINDGTLDVSCLSLAAYHKIYDDYYRDENLQAETFVPLINGRNTLYEPLMKAAPKKRAWMHDYFTACLPSPQKGPEMTLPLTQDQDIDVTLRPGNTNPAILVDAATQNPISAANVASAAGTGFVQGGATNAQINPNGSTKVTINSDAVSVNTVRRAFAIQRWLEKANRGGTRAIEGLKSFWDVNSQDSRLQRPEYIGGNKQKMVISEVLSTAEGASTPIGDLAGHGISVGGGAPYTYNVKEYGWIIGIISVLPVTAYSQGLHRSLSRRDRYDYAWPDLAHIGEQAVLNKEVYTTTGLLSDYNEEFGYIPRYSEYKYMNSRVAGQFKTSLAYWQLGREFTSKPALNPTFIEANPSRRIFATTDPTQDTIFSHIWHDVSVIRKLPRYSIPKII